MLLQHVTLILKNYHPFFNQKDFCSYWDISTFAEVKKSIERAELSKPSSDKNPDINMPLSYYVINLTLLWNKNTKENGKMERAF